MGDRILLFGRGHAWFEVSPSRGAFEHGWKRGRRGEEEEEEENKKKYIPSSLHTVYPDLWSLAPSQMKFPCRWKHGQFFILRFPYGARAGRVTYFSVLTSKWTSLVYHIYSTRPIPRNRCKERGRETICLKSRSAPFPRSVILIRSCALCYRGFSTVLVRFFFPSTFFFFVFDIWTFKGPMVFIEDWRRWTSHFLTKFLF